MRQPFSGMAERIFMKLSQMIGGKCSLHRRTQMGARPPNIFWGLKTEKSRKIAMGAYSYELNYNSGTEANF